MIAMRLYDGRNHGNAESGFRKRQEIVRRLAFEQDILLQSFETTYPVERLAGDKAGVEQQQRVLRDQPDVDRIGLRKRE